MIVDVTLDPGYQTPPDVIGAVKAFFEAQSAISPALVAADDISGRLPGGRRSGTFILIQHASSRIDRYLPIWYVTLAIRWYANSGYNAQRLWSMGHGALASKTIVHGRAWQHNGCRIRGVEFVNGPFPDVTDSDWHFRDTTYLFEADEYEVAL